MASLKSLAKDTAIYGLSSIIGRFLNYLLVTTANVANGHLTGVVSTAGRTLTVNERLLWHGLNRPADFLSGIPSLWKREPLF